MKQLAVKHLTDGANALVIGSGAGTSVWGGLEYWDFINTNAAGIGVLFTLFFGLIALAFNIYNASKSTQADKNKKEIESNSAEFKKFRAETKKGINSILDELKNNHEK